MRQVILSHWFLQDRILLDTRNTVANRGPYSQSYGFSSSHVWMWELDHKEGWAPRIDAFKLRRLLRVTWTARRSNQSILKEINPEYLLEELTLWKRSWCWKTEGGRRRDDRGWQGWMASHHGREFEQNPGDSEGQGSLECCSPWSCKEIWLRVWTTTKTPLCNAKRKN